MRQYHGIKQQVPNTLLMFRLGDFYELFYEDAVTAARELEITLTARNKEKGQPIPMCGVPYHSAENYIARLTQKGYRVAICEQMEAPSAATKLVRREVTRIITPGTTMNASLLRSHENNFLGAVMPEGARAGFAFVDVTTGEFRATEMELADAGAALETLNVREVLAPAGSPQKFTCLKTDVESWVFGADYAARSLCDHFRLLSLDGCGLEAKPLATGAAAALLHYLRETQRSALDHLSPPSFYSRADALVLDATTVRNLELVEPLFAGESRESTLLSRAGSHAHGHGRASAAAPLARAFARPRGDRSAPGCGGGVVHGHDPAERAGQGSRIDSGPGAVAVEDQPGERGSA